MTLLFTHVFCPPSIEAVSLPAAGSKIITQIEIQIRIKSTGQNLLELTRNINIMRRENKDIIADLIQTAAAGAAGAGCEIKDTLRHIKRKTFQIQDHGAVRDQHLCNLKSVFHGLRPDDTDRKVVALHIVLHCPSGTKGRNLRRRARRA